MIQKQKPPFRVWRIKHQLKLAMRANDWEKVLKLDRQGWKKVAGALFR